MIRSVTWTMTEARLGSFSLARSLPVTPASTRVLRRNSGIADGSAQPHWFGEGEVVPMPMPTTPVQGRNWLAAPMTTPAAVNPNATSSCVDSF